MNCRERWTTIGRQKTNNCDKRPKKFKIKKTVLKGKRVAAPLQLMAGQLDHLANHILAEAQKWKRTFIEKKSLLSKCKCLYFLFFIFLQSQCKIYYVHMVNIKEKTIHQISLIVYSLFLLHCIHLSHPPLPRLISAWNNLLLCARSGQASFFKTAPPASYTYEFPHHLSSIPK